MYWEAVERSGRVENFPNGSEPTVELKIARLRPTATIPGSPFVDHDGALNPGGKSFIFPGSLGFRNCAEDFD